jgi:HEPN domain-containing protein
VPPPNPAPATARDWLARARGKLALARLPLPGDAYFEDLCFLAQQAAELAIKAVYVQFGRKFARIHDLDQLLSDLANTGVAVPAGVREADQLSMHAVQTRYPGVADPVTQSDHEEAVRIAEAVVAWAATLIQ